MAAVIITLSIFLTAALKPLGKGAVEFSYHFAADGAVRHGTSRSGIPGNIRTGDVVTVLADPGGDATIYRLSSWRVVPS